MNTLTYKLVVDVEIDGEPGEKIDILHEVAMVISKCIQNVVCITDECTVIIDKITIS